MSNDNQIDIHCGPEYWKKRWVVNDISFHEENIHPYVIITIISSLNINIKQFINVFKKYA